MPIENFRAYSLSHGFSSFNVCRLPSALESCTTNWYIWRYVWHAFRFKLCDLFRCTSVKAASLPAALVKNPSFSPRPSADRVSCCQSKLRLSSSSGGDGHKMFKDGPQRSTGSLIMRWCSQVVTLVSTSLTEPAGEGQLRNTPRSTWNSISVDRSVVNAVS